MTMIKILAETGDTVTVRRKDLEALIEAKEDAEDAAAVRRHREHEKRVGWKTARQNYLTADEARRLLAGENPVRVWREKREMTQRALAEAAGIAASYLAEIEAGKKPGSVLALRKLAAALSVPMDDLVASPPQARRAAAPGRHAARPG